MMIKKIWFGLMFVISTSAFGALNPKIAVKLDREIQKVQALGMRPIGVFDLDETLLHSDRRRVHSYIESVRAAQGTLGWPNEVNRLLSVDFNTAMQVLYRTSNQYDLAEWLQGLGISSPAFNMAMERLWLPLYLSPRFMHLDRAINGSVELLQKFYRAGGRVYFVSSRYQSQQLEPTLQRLVRSGLYANSNQSAVILRRDNEDSAAFKERAFMEIRTQSQGVGKVVLTAENEPENLNLMMRIFPDALPIFVTGAYLKPEPLKSHPQLMKVRHF
jgi:hypothetical protein